MTDLEKYVEIIKFGYGYQKEELLKERKGVRVITRGNYPYDYFNFCFVNDILAQILQVLYEGYIPMVDLADRKEGDSNWGMWFEQPFAHDVNYSDYEIIREEQRIHSVWGPTYETPFADHELGLAFKLYRDFVVPNDTVMNYVAGEYQKLFSPNREKGILGCLCRGTDFTAKKPFGHPVQPSLKQLMDEVEKKLSEYSCEKIYLATEEARIEKQFEERFPGRILTNTRYYMDDRYYEATKQAGGNPVALEVVQFTDKDERYRQGLSYLSSIILLSSCDLLIAGNCGGSDAALYFNNNSYKYVNLFNLGMYGEEAK